MSSKVVYEGWMVRYGRRKIGRSFIHMRYFVLESRLLAYYKRKPQDNQVVLLLFFFHVCGISLLWFLLRFGGLSRLLFSVFCLNLFCLLKFPLSGFTFWGILWKRIENLRDCFFTFTISLCFLNFFCFLFFIFYFVGGGQCAVQWMLLKILTEMNLILCFW